MRVGMKLRILCTIAFVLGFNCLHAQWVHFVADKKVAERTKATRLAIVIKKEDPYWEKYYRKHKDSGGRLEKYRKNIETYNQHIVEAVKIAWDYTEEVIVVEEEKATMLEELGDNTYTLMKFGEYFPDLPLGAMHDHTPLTPALTVTTTRKPENPIAYSEFETILNKGLLVHNVANLNAQLHDCLENDVTTGAAWQRGWKKRTPLLKQKTILVCDRWISDADEQALQDENWLKTLPFKVKVVTMDELVDYLVTRDEQYAFYTTLFVDDCIADVKDGRHMYYHKARMNGTVQRLLEDAAKDVNKD
ncbi:MAG TPA: hypothetical protein VGK59_03535 [Ohtaekwangia sp.]